MLKQYIQTTLSPDAYHGNGKRAPFFEGWYFKLVDAGGDHALAIIPGIYHGVVPAHSHAFIMVVDPARGEVDVTQFPVEEFVALSDQFMVRIGGNIFSAESLTLNLKNYSGQVRFKNNSPWPVSVSSPGVMGWFAWMPFMECYHGIVSMDHAIEGSLRLGNVSADFTGGRGYIEKDWGRSFPQTWIWLQANHFVTPGTSIFASVARIPWIGYDFPGFIIGFQHDGVLHKFTTYNQSKLKRVSAENGVHIVAQNKTHRLEISAEPGPTILLPAPTKDRGMVPRVNESLEATVYIRLETIDGQLLFTGSSQHGGLEVEGDTQILLK